MCHDTTLKEAIDAYFGICSCFEALGLFVQLCWIFSICPLDLVSLPHPLPWAREGWPVGIASARPFCSYFLGSAQGGRAARGGGVLTLLPLCLDVGW